MHDLRAAPAFELDSSRPSWYDHATRSTLVVWTGNVSSHQVTRALVGGEAYTMPSQYTELRQTFNPGFIVLSYVIAVVGSFCTLELLLRR
jgi:hypothetical protein